MRLGVISALCAGMNIVLTFFYQVFVLASIGPGLKTDALFAGRVLPALLMAVVSGSLTHVLVPLLAVRESQDCRKELQHKNYIRTVSQDLWKYVLTLVDGFI